MSKACVPFFGGAYQATVNLAGDGISSGSGLFVANGQGGTGPSCTGGDFSTAACSAAIYVPGTHLFITSIGDNVAPVSLGPHAKGTYTLDAWMGYSIWGGIDSPPEQSAKTTLTVTVLGVAVTISGSGPPTPYLGELYTWGNFGGTNGTAPYTLTITGGALPPGLALSAAGVLSGTTTLLGAFTFTVRATDSTGEWGERTFTLTVALRGPSSMSQKTQFLDYYIELTDQAKVAALIAAVHDGGQAGSTIKSPLQAATDYGPPGVPLGTLTRFQPFVAPCLMSDWFGVVVIPGVFSGVFPLDQKSFQRKSGGWFGISWLFGTTTTYYWRGLFTYAGPTVNDPGNGVPTATPIQARNWIDGFEFPDLGDGGSGNNALFTSRAASRHVQGFGLTFRNSTSIKTHTQIENGAPASPLQWERFYVRFRRFPTAASQLWQVKGSVSGAAGVILNVLPTGQIAAINQDSSSTQNLKGSTTAIPVHTWVKIDLVYKYDAVTGQFAIYINGKSALSFTVPATEGGLAQAQNAANSTLGGGPANGLSMDVDDWVAGPWPAHITTPGLAPSIDWVAGSFVAPINPESFAPDHDASWVGDYALLRGRPTSSNSGTPITSSTSAVRASVLTDVAIGVDAEPGAIGYVAMRVCVYGLSAGPQNGQLGYALPGGGDVLAVIVESVSNKWNTVMYRPAGLLAPIRPLTGLKLIYQKAAFATNASIQVLAATAELIGTFGLEDQNPNAPAVPTQPTPIMVGIHNAPYPGSPWARKGSPPAAPVIITGGTYVGTGTAGPALELLFKAPIHWLWIRPLAGLTGGLQWFSSMLGAHVTDTEGMPNDALPLVEIDSSFVGGALLDPTLDTNPGTDPPVPADIHAAIKLANAIAYGAAHWPDNGTLDGAFPGNWTTLLGSGGVGVNVAPFGHYATVPGRWNTAQQRTRVRICGPNTQSNAAGVTYQYVAISDAAMRFLMCGSLWDWTGADYVNGLDNQAFTPEAGFLSRDKIASATVDYLYYFGPGQVAGSAQQLRSGDLAAALTVGLGTLTSKVALHGDIGNPQQVPYALFRRSDGNNNPNQAQVLQLATYTGDGSGSRTISLAPLSGKRPLFALVCSHGAAACYRDASHTGTTSTTYPSTANAATGITGGAIDSLSVGSLLNTNGVVYDVFVLPGDSVAGNGGFSINGEFILEPDSPANGPWDATPPTPDSIVDAPSGGAGGGPAGDPVPPPLDIGSGSGADFSTTCAPLSTVLINQALARIGVSKRIVDINVDLTEEASAGRLLYSEAVAAVLRDFPWPFATRYAALAVVAGTAAAPLNNDWTYSYRQPGTCIFERRIVVSRGLAVDPTPPPFQLGSDDTGRLIYTNQPNAVLEYTARPLCVASVGDALFRDALTWKLAAVLAPVLTRMTAMQELAASKYTESILKATLTIAPGYPGLRPAAPTIDVAAASQAANVAVVNRALVRIGCETITSLTADAGSEARTIFEDELQSVLRDFPWDFATAYWTPVLVAGTATVPVNPDWQYSYRLDPSIVFVRRILSLATASNLSLSPWQVPFAPSGGRAFDPNPPPYRIGRDAVGDLLYTNVVAPQIETTIRPEGCVALADAIFRDAFAWRLAACLAPSLAQADPAEPTQIGRGPEVPKAKEPSRALAQWRAQVALNAWKMYRDALARATTVDAREQQQEKPGDAEWISGRN